MLKLENTVKHSRSKHLGELQKEWTEDGVKSHHAQTSSGEEPLLKQKHRQKHLTWAQEKKNWTVAQGSRVEVCYPTRTRGSRNTFGFRVGFRVNV